MSEILNLAIGIIVLLLGIPIGNLLAKFTKEELKSGRKWFKIIVLISLIGGFVGLIIKNDAVLFTFFFISIVTSRSIMKTRKK